MTAVAQAGIGGAGGAVLEASLAAGLNFGAGGLGTIANSYISTGGPPSQRDYLLGGLSGVVTGGLSNILFPMRGVNTLTQASKFVPRTFGGMFNVFGVNTRNLWGSALFGDLFGAVLNKAAALSPS